MDVSVNYSVIGIGLVLTLFFIYLALQIGSIRASYSRKETT
jgi:LPLT family lysophospholipid transporter-like MFS transporter